MQNGYEREKGDFRRLMNREENVLKRERIEKRKRKGLERQPEKRTWKKETQELEGNGDVNVSKWRKMRLKDAQEYIITLC